MKLLDELTAAHLLRQPGEVSWQASPDPGWSALPNWVGFLCTAVHYEIALAFESRLRELGFVPAGATSRGDHCDFVFILARAGEGVHMTFRYHPAKGEKKWRWVMLVRRSHLDRWELRKRRFNNRPTHALPAYRRAVDIHHEENVSALAVLS